MPSQRFRNEPGAVMQMTKFGIAVILLVMLAVVGRLAGAKGPVMAGQSPAATVTQEK